MKNIKKILIGCDGSEYMDAIIEDLEKAGLPPEAEAIVLTVSDAWELPMVVDRVSPGAGGFVHPNVAVIRKHLAELTEKGLIVADAAAERIKKIFPAWKIRGESVCGKPAVELIKKADEWSADLIVVGSHGRSALGRLVLGSVSNKVLHEARRTVRIAKKNLHTHKQINRVLIAVDGSENALETVKEAVNRCWSEDTEFRLIAVDDPFSLPEVGYLIWYLQQNKPEDNEKSREWIAKVIDVPADILRSAGLKVSQNIRWGDAAFMILHEADEWGADSIFLGARGIGRVKRFLLGSVSSTVVTKSKCSVEVVRSKSEQ